MSAAKAPVVVLVSGFGSNLQAILEHAAAGTLPDRKSTRLNSSHH